MQSIAAETYEGGVRLKSKISAMLIAAVILLSGCSYTQTSVDQLIAPPKLSQQQSEIFAALEQSVGKNITLRYPKNGSYTSAFVMYNLDDDVGDEAIVFYHSKAATTSSLPLRINVLDQRDGKWESKYETGVDASEVERVSFVNEGGATYVVIGFNQISKGEKLIKMYQYDGGVLELIATARCSNYDVFDINGDGKSELITISAQTSESSKSSIATAYRIWAKGFTSISNTDMDPDVIEYFNINGGKLKNGIPALYLDGALDSTNINTQILYMENDRLVNAVYSPIKALNLISETVRYAGSISLDLDENGVYYIPQTKDAPGYENSPKHETQLLTQWLEYDNHAFNLVKTSYIDYKLGFIFSLPQKWNGLVTLEKSTSENEVVFYQYTGSVYDKSKQLLSIKVVKKAEYGQAAIKNTHSVLKDNGQLMYLYRLYESSPELDLSEPELRNCFKLLQGGNSNEANPGV